MMAAKMALCGWGIYSDQFTNAGALSQVVKRLIGKADVTISNVLPAHATTSRFPDLELTISALDAVSQYAFRALHEALCNAEAVTPDRTALLLLSAWGPTENTLNFLDSMLEADGRYASPRHFTRSVYSTVASHAAIYFGIHGPCETLAHGQWPVCCVLDRAADLLASGRVDYVVACWADQASAFAKDLCRRSVAGLDRKEFSRFTSDDSGYGAVALVLKRVGDAPSGGLMLDIQNPIAAPAVSSLDAKLNIHSFPTDGAVHLAAVIAAAEAADGTPSVLFTESDVRCNKRSVHLTALPLPGS
jgi:hypothetical protein